MYPRTQSVAFESSKSSSAPIFSAVLSGNRHCIATNKPSRMHSKIVDCQVRRTENPARFSNHARSAGLAGMSVTEVLTSAVRIQMQRRELLLEPYAATRPLVVRGPITRRPAQNGITTSSYTEKIERIFRRTQFRVDRAGHWGPGYSGQVEQLNLDLSSTVLNFFTFF